MEREGHPQPATAEWPVTFRFKLQGGRELGPAARAFADRIAADEYVTRVSEESRPDVDTVHVTALVVASSENEAQQRSKAILSAARSSAGKTIPDWSTTGWWSGHDIDAPPREPC
jgi:hypothetical protein